MNSHHVSMKALSIKQPWASLIDSGAKTIEVRSWTTKYRGPLLICAGASPMKGFKWASPSLLGKALCVAQLVDVVPFDLARHGEASCIPQDMLHMVDGHFAWILQDIREIEPFEVKGQLGIFDVAGDF